MTSMAACEDSKMREEGATCDMAEKRLCRSAAMKYRRLKAKRRLHQSLQLAKAGQLFPHYRPAVISNVNPPFYGVVGRENSFTVLPSMAGVLLLIFITT